MPSFEQVHYWIHHVAMYVVLVGFVVLYAQIGWEWNQAAKKFLKTGNDFTADWTVFFVLTWQGRLIIFFTWPVFFLYATYLVKKAESKKQ